MNLIIFDIDGTLTDSVKMDDACFTQALQEVAGLNLADTNWSNFKHVTDIGLTQEAFQRTFQREPGDIEIRTIKEHFYTLIKERRDEVHEIPGARMVFQKLLHQPNTACALATGGWKETALLKLNHIRLDIGDSILTSANDHFDRKVITQLAITQALNRYGLRQFHSITYVGDGLWDFKTSESLGIHFVGIDFHQNGRLKNAGAPYVIQDLTHLENILDLLP